MSLERDPGSDGRSERDPGADGLSVSHIGGGSARRAAVLVGGVLAVVVWVGVSGRAPAPNTPALTPAAVAVEPESLTPTAGASEAAPDQESPRPLGTDTPSPDIAPATPREAIFAATLRLGNREYLDILSETLPGRLEANIELPERPPARDGIVAFDQLFPPKDFEAIRIGEWPVTLNRPGAGGSRDELLVNQTVPARPQDENAPLPVVSGYLMVVYTSNSQPGALNVSVFLGPD